MDRAPSSATDVSQKSRQGRIISFTWYLVLSMQPRVLAALSLQLWYLLAVRVTDVKQAALIKLGHKDLIAPQRILFLDAPNPVRMLGKPTTDAVYTPWSIIQIVELIVFLPLNFVPVVGTPAFIIITGTRLGKLAHYRWFQLKGYSKIEQKKALRDRAWEYIWFGTVAMILELVPVLSLFFLLTTTAGAAQWTAEVEDENRTSDENVQNGQNGYHDQDGHNEQEQYDDHHPDAPPPPYTDDLELLPRPPPQATHGPSPSPPLPPFQVSSPPPHPSSSSPLFILNSHHEKNPLLIPFVYFRSSSNSPSLSSGTSSYTCPLTAARLSAPTHSDRPDFLSRRSRSYRMRISASLGLLMASGFLGYSASQATDYGNTNGSPIGNQPDSSGNGIPGNNGGLPNTLPYPSNAAGSIPGSLPSGVGPVGPVSPGDGSNGLPPNSPVGGPEKLPGSVSPGGGSNGPYPNGPDGIPGNLPGSNSPGDGSNGFPPNGPTGGSGNLPESVPGGSPTNGQDNAPGNIPGAGSVIIPGSFPTNIPQNVPGSPDSPPSGASDIPTCPLRSTKTVVVTIYPTDSQSESGFHWPDDSDSDESYTPTPMPTKPPGITSLPSNSGVPIFTTLTLDIWGPGGSPSNSGSGRNDDTGSSNGNQSNDGSSPGSGPGNNDGTNSHDGNGSGSNGESDSHNNPDSPFFPPTPGQNGAPQYSDRASDGLSAGNQGASGINTLAPTPLQTPGFPNGGIPGNQPQSPSAGPDQEASDSLPVTTQAGSEGQGETSPWFTNIPGGDGASQPSPSYMTIPGQDGLPTVISSGGNAISGNAQPSAAPGSPENGNSPELPNGISSGFPIPSPIFTGIPESQNPSNSPAGSLPGSGPDAGVTTCATFIITGPNGLPTVVDSTWVIPLSTPSFEESSQLSTTFDPQGPLSTISSELGLPTTPVPTSGSPEDGPGGSAAITSTSFTIIGADGNPTVVYTTWNIPAATASSGDPGDASAPASSGDFVSITALPPFGSSGLGDQVTTAPGPDDVAQVTTCTSYTVIGVDGLPTVIDSTFVIPGPVNTDVTIGGDPELPSGASDALPNGVTSPATSQVTNTPEIPSHFPTAANGPGGLGSDGITTCTSYTMIGSDGLPTVVDTTWVIPGSVNTQSELPANPSFVSDSLPSGLPTGIPGLLTSSAGIPSDDTQGNMPSITTCITYTIVGQDGLPTIVDTTFVIPLATATPPGTSLTLPTADADGQIGSLLNHTGAYTITTTAAIMGPDGNPTPTLQTIVFSDFSALGVSVSAPQGVTSGISGPLSTSGDWNPLSTDTPSLNGYGDGIPDASVSAILTDGSAAAEGTSVVGTTTGTLTWTITSITNPPGAPIFSDNAAQPPFVSNPSDGTPGGPAQPAYGSIATESTLWPLSAVQTSTWTNVIKAETTSYTFNYPLTTLATVNVPMRRLARRQAMTAWSNSTTSLSSETSASTATTSEASSPTVCPAGGSIGNTTIDFDNSKPGPLFNPVEDIWFSGGFLIAPPTSQQPQPYIPSSGGQLVEFVPPALSNTTTTISGDVAQIGVGSHASSPCFRFDFFGANLGCDARGDEKWCEFDISAYRWNETSSTEESIAWSETKQVPACPKFSEGGYQLTRIDLDGYKDLSSILITLRVSSNLRVWWGDDFRVGWSDNSCIAASCRANSPSQFVKRETVISALRQGVYRWTPHELKRLDDSLVWESAN
ncbi:hypothetical protein FSPOR_1920 [Fusarium sporotrichioides]|uniref:DUF7371 domain-containing protein n=1 Tax=Fusarium sporotrichioides TaxID=5514 RepID=A0A395SQH7_FUSSP|nr:hypothetical protein FSPOR_1920 [Fusarium sporotrichioides]